MYGVGPPLQRVAFPDFPGGHLAGKSTPPAFNEVRPALFIQAAQSVLRGLRGQEATANLSASLTSIRFLSTRV
jgi:hypothetical protein